MPAPRKHASGTPALEARGITKRFPGVRALDDVSIKVYHGEVVGVVGENGSGKSTLLSTVSGAISRNAGSIFVNGQEQKVRNYLEANSLGLFRAHQDQGLINSMSVVDNMYLGHEREFSTFGLLRRRRMRHQAQERLDAQLERRHVDATDVVGDLSLDVRELIEIIRAFALSDLLKTGPPVVMLDETTASLSLDEVSQLYDYINSHRASASFLFVSHRLQEIFQLCDWIYVLKDGQLVTELNPSDADESLLHSYMVGRVREELYYKEDLRPAELGEPLLEIEGLTAEPYFADFSLTVLSGEIVTVGGVTGSGKSELARALAGDLRVSRGEIRVRGRSVTNAPMGERTKHIGYGPLDRHKDGVSLNQSIALNVTLAALDKITIRPGLLSPSLESTTARAAIARYNIGARRSERDRVGLLSGGNQQKVMLARLVAPGPGVLVLDNPTRGVDAGARQDIYAHLRRLTREGTAILMITDDMQELIGMADRIATMRDGRLREVFDDARSHNVTEEQVVSKMM
jgi:ribose transport system ATP-binding protein